jgi:cobalt-zinc-cadmium efflux system protein
MSGGHGHSHAPVASAGSATAKHRRSLIWALALTAAYLVAELIGAIVTGSLALLADAAHMLTDAGGLALALFAIWFAARPATPTKTYGYLRTEILAALANALVLLSQEPSKQRSATMSGPSTTACFYLVHSPHRQS